MQEIFSNPSAKPITLVKIGGSLISDKSKEYSVERKVLRAICHEVKIAQDAGHILLLGHGAGSFAHVPAKKYQTHRGFIDEHSKLGVVEVAAAARAFNQIIMEELLRASVLAVSVAPLSAMTASNHELATLHSTSVELLLRLGIIPVVFGDQIIDEKIGCTVFPTEKVLAVLALSLKNAGFTISSMIHCSKTGGVLDASGAIIPHISPQNIDTLSAMIGGAVGTDVSGGMKQKVSETISLAKEGIPGLIIDGVRSRLSEALDGKPVAGTRITAL